MPDPVASALRRVREDLDSASGRDRLGAVRDLAPYAAAPAVVRVLEDLAASDADPRVQIVSREVLRAAPAGAPPQSSTPPADAAALSAALRSPSSLARLEALESLPASVTAAEPLEEHAKTTPGAVEAAAAVEALARVAGARSQPALVRFSADPRPRVAAAALGCLARLGHVKTVELLATAVSATAPAAVRRCAARALHDAGPQEGHSRLLKVLADSPDPAARSAAQDALLTLATPESLADLAGWAAIAADVALAERAFELLGRSGDRRAVTALAALDVLTPERSELVSAALSRLRGSVGLARPAFDSLVARAARKPEPPGAPPPPGPVPGARPPAQPPIDALRHSRALAALFAAFIVTVLVLAFLVPETSPEESPVSSAAAALKQMAARKPKPGPWNFKKPLPPAAPRTSQTREPAPVAVRSLRDTLDRRWGNFGSP